MFLSFRSVNPLFSPRYGSPRAPLEVPVNQRLGVHEYIISEVLRFFYFNPLLIVSDIFLYVHTEDYAACSYVKRQPLT